MSSKNPPAIAVAAAAAPATTRLIAKPQVLARIPWSDTTLWRRCKDGSFPAPVRISANRVAWREADVEAWIARPVLKTSI